MSIIVIAKNRKPRKPRPKGPSDIPKCRFKPCTRRAILRAPGNNPYDMSKYQFCSLTCAEQHAMSKRVERRLREESPRGKTQLNAVVLASTIRGA